MNDYLFGNRLLAYRTAAGLTQQALGALTGVSDKAVSKWETGKTKPSTQTLRKLSAVLGVSVEELLKIKEEKIMPEISKIVITGGPCAGKTTAMSKIQDYFSSRGYVVLFVPETATELISGGVAPWTCGTVVAYQICQMALQLKKEELFEQAAASMNTEKVLIVCDRGALDNKAYMDSADFTQVLRAVGRNEVELRDNYDAVFHLVTAAKGATEAYTLSNNSARTETPEQAAALDEKLLAAWTGHPHLRVIDNSTDFEHKIHRLLVEITTVLGDPIPYEIERKFLIEYPDMKWLEGQPFCRKVEIIQTYLKSEGEEEIRLRQRGDNGGYVYFETRKRSVSPVKRIETERRLTQSEYLERLMEADTTRHQIRKTRYCLTYENQYFEIDIYPFWQDKAIAEIELSEEDTPVTFPKELHVIKEVTEDMDYRNSALAKL